MPQELVQGEVDWFYNVSIASIATPMQPLLHSLPSLLWKLRIGLLESTIRLIWSAYSILVLIMLICKYYHPYMVQVNIADYPSL
jgi:hypothetical protein